MRGLPEGSKTPNGIGFGWGMGLDGDGWACLRAVTIAGQSVLLPGAAATVEVVERSNQHRHKAIGWRYRIILYDQTKPGFNSDCP